MNAYKRFIPVLVMVAIMPFFQGCAALLVGGMAAGATYGTIKYTKNTLHVTHSVTLDRAWDAANAALKDLNMPVLSTKKDGTSGTIKSRNALDQPVTVEVKREGETATEVQITVGTFESDSNRAIAQQIHDKLKSHL